MLKIDNKHIVNQCWIIAPRAYVFLTEYSGYDVPSILKDGTNVYVIGSEKLNRLTECHTEYIFLECDVDNKSLTGKQLNFKELSRLNKMSQI